MATSVQQVISVCIVLVGVTTAYPYGAPAFACQGMVPSGHGNTSTSGPPPFAINVTTAVYKPGSIVTGSIYSPSNVKFKGFLIQARSAANDDSAPIGLFIDPVNLTHTQCGNNAEQGLTHSNATEKSSLLFTWKAPDEFTGDVKFKVTVVEQFYVSRYWLNIHSDTIMDCSLHTNEAECNEITSEAPETSPTGTLPQTTPTTPTTQTTPTTPKTPSTPPPGKLVYDPDCGLNKGCFADCASTSDTCTYLVTWQAAEDKLTVQFDIKMAMGSMDNTWVAAGFSDTGFMDGTEVMACLSKSQRVVLQSSMNRGYSNQVFKNSTLGFVGGSGSTEDGVFHCSVTRMTNMSDPEVLSLTDQYYLLVAHGPVIQGFMSKHSRAPKKTENKVDFLEFGVPKADDSVSVLIKIHASLMVFAWVFLSSLGLVAARHCKDMCAEKLYLGVKAWFAVHRPAMILATLCVIGGMIAIFIEVGRFSSQPAGPSYTEAHPYLGIIVSGLTALNPIMAMFRPGADSKKRYIFNWAHFTVGSSAHISAIVTIFFGLKLERARVNIVAFYVMVVYAIVFLLVQFTLEVHNSCRKQPAHQTKYVSYGSVPGVESSFPSATTKGVGPLSATDPTLSTSSKLMTVPIKRAPSSVPAYVLTLHGVIMLGMAGFLIAVICVPLKLM